MDESLYESLSGRDIRVLDLFPGPWDSQIKCELRILHVSSGSEYEALSYVWGHQSDLETIIVNSRPFQITGNLFRALRRIRTSSTNIRTLWVDSICINQSDLNEKSHQVQMMSQIYHETKRCLIWLGEEPNEPVPLEAPQTMLQVQQIFEDMQLAFKGFDKQMSTAKIPSQVKFEDLFQPLPDIKEEEFRVGRTKPMVWIGEKKEIESIHRVLRNERLKDDCLLHAFSLIRYLAECKCFLDIPHLNSNHGLSPPWQTNALRGLHFLVACPWWSRIWTVQECVLPEAKTLIYGPVQMSWDIITKAATWYHEHRLSSCCRWLIPNAATLDRLHDQVALLDRQAVEQMKDPGVRLTWLLQTFRPRFSSNDKDKVYALLPMLPGVHAEEYIIPDYSSKTTPEEIFVQTVLTIIKSTKSLDVFHRNPRDDENIFKLLPSWTPDFSTSPTLHGLSSHFNKQIRLYDACGGQKADLYDIESNILVVKGYLIDEIAYTTWPFEWNDKTTRTAEMAKWTEFAREHLSDLNKVSDLPEKESISSSRWTFMRTICGDTISKVSEGESGQTTQTRITLIEECHTISSEIENEFGSTLVEKDQVYKKLRVANTDEEDTQNKILSIVQSTVSGRCLFISKTNKALGICPKGAATRTISHLKMNEIFVLTGGHMPFVLRPVGSRHIPGRGLKFCYTLIGQCYLHGFMDGEGVKRGEPDDVYLV